MTAQQHWKSLRVDGKYCTVRYKHCHVLRYNTTQTQYNTILYNTILYYTTLHYTTLHYTTLHYTIRANSTVRMYIYIYIQLMCSCVCINEIKLMKNQKYVTCLITTHLLLKIMTRTPLLIATDVAARGLDIPQVEVRYVCVDVREGVCVCVCVCVDGRV